MRVGTRSCRRVRARSGLAGVAMTLGVAGGPRPVLALLDGLLLLLGRRRLAAAARAIDT